MNAIDILGSLLGGGGSPAGGQSGGSLGGKILGELIKAGMGGGQQPPETAPASSRGRNASARPVDIQSEAKRLEEMLGVATGKRTAGTTSAASPQASPYRPAPPQPRYQPQSQPQAQSLPKVQLPPASSQPSSQMTSEDEAIVLIRALVNAAKADGKLDQQEQQAVVSRVSNNPEAINFIKQELANPLDVREFAWSVPLGMEVQVFTMSLAAIELDNQAEVDYLRELAHGLRLDPEACNEILARYRAPAIF